MGKYTDRLQCTTERSQTGREVVTLTGCFDEHAAEVLSRAVTGIGPQVTLDLGGVRRINSLGVRAWVRFLESLGDRDIVLKRCMPAFVDQLNTIAAFRGQARVESVMAPYLCEPCAQVSFEELTLGVDVPQRGSVEHAPQRPCPTCGGSMDLDDFAERYFGFLALAE